MPNACRISFKGCCKRACKRLTEFAGQLQFLSIHAIATANAQQMGAMHRLQPNALPNVNYRVIVNGPTGCAFLFTPGLLPGIRVRCAHGNCVVAGLQVVTDDDMNRGIATAVLAHLLAINVNPCVVIAGADV